MTAYTITFAAPLNPEMAGNASFYKVFEGVTKAVKGHKQTLFTRSLKIKSVAYDAGARSVTIALASAAHNGKVHVTIEPGLEAADGAANDVAITQVVPQG